MDEYLTVPGHPEIHACGDAAAVPDLTRPGSITAMTAQHAERQGKLVADNVAASLRPGRRPDRRRPYRHHDLGFVVDLGGTEAAADPLGVRLSGLPAKAVTRGYHLLSMPRQPDPHRHRLGARRRVPPPARAAGARPLSRGPADGGDARAPGPVGDGVAAE